MQPTETTNGPDEPGDLPRPAGTSARRGGAVGALAAAARLVGSAGSRLGLGGARSDHPPIVPPPQLSQLDFLVGDLHCTFHSGSILRTRGTRILGGTWVQLDMRSPNSLGNRKIHGTWTLGWDRLRSEFVAYYYDDNLNHGATTGPGWQDGEFTLVGDFVFTEAPQPIRIKDVFTRVDEDRFTLVEYGEVEGEWKVLNTQDCVRTRRR